MNVETRSITDLGSLIWTTLFVIFSKVCKLSFPGLYLLLFLLLYKIMLRLNVIKQGVMIANSAIICSDDSIVNLSNEKKSRNKEIDIMQYKYINQMLSVLAKVII